MKKLILLLFIPLVFTCSSDSSDDSQQDNNNFDNYPKLISYTREQPNLCDGIKNLYEYSYSGDKILSFSARVYWLFYGGECNYFGNDGYINNTVNNVYSGDFLISQNMLVYNPYGEQTNNYIISYEYYENGLVSKMIEQRLDNNGEVIDSDEFMFFWTNDNLTRQMTDSNGLTIEVKNYDSNYNCLETHHYSEGQIFHTKSSSFDLTKFNTLANSHKFWVWNGAGPRNHNQVVSEYINDISDDSSYELYFEHAYNEYGFSSYTTINKSNDPSYFRIYNYNYE